MFLVLFQTRNPVTGSEAWKWAWSSFVCKPPVGRESCSVPHAGDWLCQTAAAGPMLMRLMPMPNSLEALPWLSGCSAHLACAVPRCTCTPHLLQCFRTRSAGDWHYGWRGGNRSELPLAGLGSDPVSRYPRRHHPPAAKGRLHLVMRMTKMLMSLSSCCYHSFLTNSTAMRWYVFTISEEPNWEFRIFNASLIVTEVSGGPN